MKIRHITLVPFKDSNGKDVFVNPEAVSLVSDVGYMKFDGKETPKAVIQTVGDGDCFVVAHGITAAMAAHALTSADIVVEAEP